MTGPEHYREAEALIGIATDDGYSGHRIPAPGSDGLLALARVHATLALAAATARAAELATGSTSEPNTAAWLEVTS
jgi:hypothetical protein